jgi:hypothetical protein
MMASPGATSHAPAWAIPMFAAKQMESLTSSNRFPQQNGKLKSIKSSVLVLSIWLKL